MRWGAMGRGPADRHPSGPDCPARTWIASHLVPVVVGGGMSDVTAVFDAGLTHWVVGGVLSMVLGLAILVYPGPVSITDRLPFGLLFLVSGILAVYTAHAEATSPV
jgi:uncharacterized membrane protein HdeD (DUF308 family)